MEGVQTPAQGAGAAARTVPQAGGHPQAKPRAARPPGARAGEHLPSGTAILSGLAANLREVGPALRAGDVRRTVVSSGCECWRDHRLDQRLACATFPDMFLWPSQEEGPLRALACVPLWHE